MDPEDIVADPNTPDPALVADPAADPVLAADPADPPTPPAVTPEPPSKRVADNPLLSTLAELRARDAQRETEMAKLRQEAADARQLAERLAKGDKPDSTPLVAPRTPPAPDDAEIDRRAAQRVFERDVASVSATGAREFGAEWQKTINGLNAIGIDNNFLAQVIDVDREVAHAVLQDLGEDLERAARLVKLTPTQRIAEFTRMADAKTKKAEPAPPPPAPEPKAAPKAVVSKAPPPAPAITPRTMKPPGDWRYSDDDDTFHRGFDTMIKERPGMRR
jgi:hypothetical protein